MFHQNTDDNQYFCFSGGAENLRLTGTLSHHPEIDECLGGDFLEEKGDCSEVLSASRSAAFRDESLRFKFKNRPQDILGGCQSLAARPRCPQLAPRDPLLRERKIRK
jgi:hypothetical protein